MWEFEKGIDSKEIKDINIEYQYSMGVYRDNRSNELHVSLQGDTVTYKS